MHYSRVHNESASVCIGRWVVTCALMVALGIAVLPASAGRLVNNGLPSGTIVVSSFSGNEPIVTAANDLAAYVKQMSGATVPVRWDTTFPPPFRVLIGSTSLYPVNPADVTEDKVGHDGFIIKTVTNGVLIAGRTVKGTAHGVYYFAENVLGAHWYSVEDDAPTCPPSSTIDIPTLNLTIKPDFAYRGQYYSFQQSSGYQPSTNPLHLKLSQNRDKWWAFNRMNGINAEIGHAYDAIVPPELFSTHPEYFPYIDYTFAPGSSEKIMADENGNLPYYPWRTGRYWANGSFQRCFGNLNVQQMAIDYTAAQFAADPTLRYASLSENDGPWWCEDALCEALGATHSHRNLAIANVVAEANEAAYPDRGYIFLAYMNTIAPATGMVAHHNVVPAIAPLWQCRLHPISSSCPDSAYVRSVIEGWDTIADQLTYYNYTTGAPFTFPGPLALTEEMRFHRDRGSIGGLRENQFLPEVNWQMLNWMETHLWWDVDQDPVQLRRQFIEGYYGTAAADAIERLYDGLEAGIREDAGSRTWPKDPGDGLHGLSGSEVLKPYIVRLQADIRSALTTAASQPDPFKYRINRDMGAILIGLPGSLTGSVNLMDYTGDPSGVSIKIQFRQGGSTVRTAKVFLDANGRFVVDPVDSGIYDIAFKSPTSLQKVLPNVPVTGATDVGIISMTGGDLNGDNTITSDDCGIVLPNLDQTGDM